MDNIIELKYNNYNNDKNIQLKYISEALQLHVPPLSLLSCHSN